MYYNTFYQGQPENGEEQINMSRMGMRQMPLNSDINLLNDVAQSIILEAHAYNFYQRLAELAPNEQDRQIIFRIQRDEAKHYHWFTMILRRMGGQQPQLTIGALPQEFKEGVRTAIFNELEAASFYQDIAYRATDHMTQMHFMHASHDEQRHASWFEYMLINL
jgi:rubrerythrin